MKVKDAKMLTKSEKSGVDKGKLIFEYSFKKIFHPIVPDKSTGPPPLQPPREAMLLAELIW